MTLPGPGLATADVMVLGAVWLITEARLAVYHARKQVREWLRDWQVWRERRNTIRIVGAPYGAPYPTP